MPIVAFENRRTAPLELVVEPMGERHEVPHLATVGIRYTLEDGVEDFSTSVVGDQDIEFWCNAASVEVDIVYPSPFDRLLWDICVNLGFCGGLMNGEPTHVSDLIPEAGVLGAAAFADLVIRADGGGPTRLRQALEAKFVEHLGVPVVPVEQLKGNHRRPFDPPDPAK
jgi:hypothetical protein